MLSKIKFDNEKIVKEPTYNDEWILKAKNKSYRYFHIIVNRIPFMVDEVEVGEEHIRLFKNDHMVCGVIYKEMLLENEIEIV